MASADESTSVPTTRDAFLDEATAGLISDPELRLEARAELAARLDEALATHRTAGLADAEAEAEAVRSMGDAATLAASLAERYRPRLRRRARLKHTLRWLLVPLAIAAAVWASGWMPGASPFDFYNLQMAILSDSLPDRVPGDSSLTERERLIVYGDLSREDWDSRRRAIWEMEPDNPVFLGHYLTWAQVEMARKERLGERDTETFLALFEQARRIDPGNARYDYLIAAAWFAAAAEIESERVGKDDRGRELLRYRLEVHDEAKLAKAIEALLEATRQPRYQRYAREMLLLRLDILGPPTTQVEQCQQLSMMWGVLQNDYLVLADLARAAALEGERRLAAGEPDAEELLAVWQRIAAHMNQDAYSLADVTSVRMLGRVATEISAPALAEVDARASDAMAEQSRELTGVVETWKAGRDRERTRGPDSRGSLLCGMLLPGLGFLPQNDEQRLNRLLDYVVTERLALFVFSLLLMLYIVVATGAFSLRWWRGTGETAPIPLLPSGRVAAQAVVFGIVVPIAAYAVVTRWLPWTERTYCVAIAWPQFMVQVSALLYWKLAVIWWSTDDWIRRRCVELGIDMPPVGLRRKLGPWLGIVLALAALLPFDPDFTGPWPHLAIGGSAALLLVYLCIFAGIVGLARQQNAFLGTRARAMIPYLALAMIALNVLAGPALAWRERYLVQHDKLLTQCIREHGVSAPEYQLVTRLREEMAAVMAGWEEE